MTLLLTWQSFSLSFWSSWITGVSKHAKRLLTNSTWGKWGVEAWGARRCAWSSRREMDCKGMECERTSNGSIVVSVLTCLWWTDWAEQAGLFQINTEYEGSCSFVWDGLYWLPRIKFKWGTVEASHGGLCPPTPIYSSGLGAWLVQSLETVLFIWKGFVSMFQTELTGYPWISWNLETLMPLYLECWDHRYVLLCLALMPHLFKKYKQVRILKM